MNATIAGAGFGQAALGKALIGAALALGLAGAPAAADEAQSAFQAASALAQLPGDSKRGLAGTTGERAFTRVAGLPAGDLGIDVPDDASETAALSGLRRLNDADAVVAVMAEGAQDQALTDLLISDSTGSVDLARAIERVRVGERTPQWTCLTEALYHEARGETLPGLLAVGEVILNRVDSAFYPDTVCEVVGQGMEYAPLCQFSYKCDGLPDRMSRGETRALMEKVAWVMISGKPRILTGKATHYHTNAVNPGWAARLVRTARIGDHIFYRRGTELSAR